MPSHCSVASIVEPRIGLPLSECRTRPVGSMPFSAQIVWMSAAARLSVFALMDLQADDAAAPDVDHEVQVEEASADRGRQPV